MLATIDSLATPVSFGVTSGDDPLPTILSKVEKFASSLKGLQESGEYSKPSLCSVSSIRSLDDVINTLKVFNVSCSFYLQLRFVAIAVIVEGVTNQWEEA